MTGYKLRGRQKYEIQITDKIGTVKGGERKTDLIQRKKRLESKKEQYKMNQYETVRKNTKLCATSWKYSTIGTFSSIKT